MYVCTIWLPVSCRYILVVKINIKGTAIKWYDKIWNPIEIVVDQADSGES